MKIALATRKFSKISVCRHCVRWKLFAWALVKQQKRRLPLAILLTAMVAGCRTASQPPVVHAMPPMPQSAVFRLAPPAPAPPLPNVVIAFDAPADTSNINGYRIYYRDEVGVTNFVDLGLATTSAITLEQNVSYKLWAVSRSADGLESLPSNEISHIISITVPTRTAVIVLWTGSNALGPWLVALTTNRVQVSATNAFFNQTITLE